MPRGARRRSSRQLRWTPYPVPSEERASLELEKRVWKDAICPVCLEYPHNAVLLLCSSHDKGCRPYMCGTSYHHSNCLYQFKKACTKVTSTTHHHGWGLLAMFRWFAREKSEVMELACPLCRGQVKGWALVKRAREYLNNKERSCMQDNCSFVGTYRELRTHVRSEHPSANPHKVDPVLEQRWRTLEHEMEQQDVISAIRSSMPRADVLGDYVIDVNNSDLELDDEAGDDDGHDEGGGSHGIGRIILYFLREGLRVVLREVALVIGLYEENSSSEDSEEDDDVYAHEENSSSEDSEEDDDVYAPPVNGAGAVAGAADIITTAASHGAVAGAADIITTAASHGRGAEI